MIEAILFLSLMLGVGTAFKGNRDRALNAEKQRADWRVEMKNEVQRGR